MKLEMIKKKKWDDWKRGSGKLTNPGKIFYLKLAASMIRDVGDEKDRDRVSYVRNAMIGSGMALNLNGNWEVRLLFSHLLEIVQK